MNEMIPTSAAASAVLRNSRILVRLTGTPTLRAALASPPEAKIQLPNEVRLSTQLPTIVTTMNQMIAVL